MKIDQLPVEMLIKIFSFLPAKGEASLVNKLFYNIWCQVNDSNICLRINRRFFECLLYSNTTSYQLLQSILTSNRQISKVEIEGTEALPLVISDLRRKYVISAIEKFSATVKFLKFTRVYIDGLVFLEILSLTPNIEHLNLFELGIRDGRCHSDDLNLKKLKSLSIINCSEEFPSIFKSLPDGALTELQICNFKWSALTDILSKQLNIKALKLECGRDDIPTSISKKLALEHLDLVVYKINRVPTISAILSKQTKLKSLTFSSAKGYTERAVNTIVNLLEMGVLEVNTTKSPFPPFANIQILKKLRDLKLQCNFIDNFSKLKAIAESARTSVAKSEPDGKSEMTVDLIIESPKVATHLMKFRRQMSFGTERKTIFHHFNFIDGLEIPNWKESVIVSDISLNNELTGLEIFDTSERFNLLPWLSILSRAYPHLRSFKLTVLHSFSLDIQPILNSFAYLTSLIVRSAKQLYVEDWDCLQKHNDTLKLVSVRGLEDLVFNNKQDS